MLSRALPNVMSCVQKKACAVTRTQFVRVAHTLGNTSVSVNQAIMEPVEEKSGASVSIVYFGMLS